MVFSIRHLKFQKYTLKTCKKKKWYATWSNYCTRIASYDKCNSIGNKKG